MTLNNNLVKSKSLLSQIPTIHTTNDSQMKVSHIGNISMSTLSLLDTFVVPKLSLDLIFVGQLCELDFDIHFSSNGCCVQDRRTR